MSRDDLTLIHPIVVLHVSPIGALDPWPRSLPRAWITAPQQDSPSGIEETLKPGGSHPGSWPPEVIPFNLQMKETVYKSTNQCSSVRRLTFLAAIAYQDCLWHHHSHTMGPQAPGEVRQLRVSKDRDHLFEMQLFLSERGGSVKTKTYTAEHIALGQVLALCCWAHSFMSERSHAEIRRTTPRSRTSAPGR